VHFEFRHLGDRKGRRTLSPRARGRRTSRTAHHARSKPPLADAILELEESTDEFLHLRLCGGFEKQSACLRLPVRKEHEEARLHPALVIVRALVVGEAAFDAVEVRASSVRRYASRSDSIASAG
jgi:hypothetical protein